jgi:hypothetical protein
MVIGTALKGGYALDLITMPDTTFRDHPFYELR